MKLATLATSLALAGCVGVSQQPAPLQEPAVKDSRIVREFQGFYDGEARTLTFEFASELGSTAQALGEAPVVRDGVAGSGPTNTVELVTTTVADGTGCGGFSLDADVTLRSFYGASLGTTYVEILSMSPATGFEICDPKDSHALLNNGFGLINYGDIGAGAAVAKTWRFSRLGTGNFTFKGRVVSTWCGLGGCVGWCNVQWVPNPAPAASFTAYGRVYVAGRTDVWGLCHPSIESQFGWGPAGSDPRTSGSWSWVSGVGNESGGACVGGGNNDEHMATVTTAAPGTYRGAWRFRLNDVAGSAWSYCDSNGAGWNNDVIFSPTDLPTFTVE